MNIIYNLKNPRRAAYMVGAVTKRTLPIPLAKLLATGNRTAMPNTVDIPTYDGSGQTCHPTISSFQGKVYMACTPYPYGVEYYENPCLYVRDSDSRRWKPVPGVFPLILPERLGFEHYSDPCLFQQDGKLVLLFRKNERRPEGTVELLYTSATTDGKSWSAPRLLAEGGEDALISPAATGGELFCVEREIPGNVDSSTRLVRYALDGLSGLGGRTVCRMEGLEQGFLVWHIECATLPNGTVRGLFMLQEKFKTPIQSKLALFRWEPEKNLWSFERDLPPTEAERNTVAFVYKSCFTEDPNLILCSACDQKRRYFLYEKLI